jgi:hypothetical protein
MKGNAEQPKICSTCKHAESDHVDGHCNGISNRQKPIIGNMTVGVMSDRDLCNCVQFTA